MTGKDFHTLVPKEFEEAVAYGHGAIAGWMYGKGAGNDLPLLTDELKQAYERAFASVFNAGYSAGYGQGRDDEAAGT